MRLAQGNRKFCDQCGVMETFTQQEFCGLMQTGGAEWDLAEMA